jgi:hypothetical protein
MPPRRFAVTLVAALAATFAFAACKTDKGGAGPGSGSAAPSGGGTTTAENPDQKTPVTELKILDSLPAPAAAPAGPAWLVIENNLVTLDDKGFHPVAGVKFIFHVAVAPDGNVWAWGTNSYKIAGGKDVQELPDAAVTGDDAVFAKNGDVWIWSSINLAKWGGGWTTFTKEQIAAGSPDAADDGGIRGMALDGKDRPVVVTGKWVHILDAGQWKHQELKASVGDVLPLKVVAGDDGKVYIITSGGLVVLDGDKLVMRGLPGGTSGFDVKTFAKGPPGELYAIGESWFVVIRPADDGARVVPFSTGDLGIIDSTAVDQAGRVWIAGKGGFVVVDRSGSVTKFPPGTVPELAADVSGMAIVGAGPPLPAVAEIQRGNVVGVVTDGGKPVAGVPVEICAQPRSIFSANASPCGEEPFHMEVLTATDGSFKFDGVPVGAYGFAVKGPGGKWIISMRDFCKGMKEGGTCEAPLDIAQ